MSKVTIKSFISVRQNQDRAWYAVLIIFDDGKIMQSENQVTYNDAVKLEKEMMKNLERIL